MKNKAAFIMAFSLILSIGLSFGQSAYVNMKSSSISTSELSKWRFLGKGEMLIWGEQVSLKEAEGSLGVTLLSPEKYTNDIIMQYKIMALTPATVIVTLLSVSDQGVSDEFSVPDNYDGSIGLWKNEKENYFFAFKNAPHNVTPFVRKNPNATATLVQAPKNYMVAGVYYTIEVGNKDGKLWLSIDGEKVFETTDPSPLSGGHAAIRLRGTAGFVAGCLIKDMVILH